MRSTRSKIKSVARGTVVGAVMASPWLFGGAEPWAFLLIALMVSIGFAAWLVSLFLDSEVEIPAAGVTAGLLFLMTFLFIQMLPLPYSWVKVVSPLSAEVQAKRDQIFESADVKKVLPPEQNKGVRFATISASPAGTRRAFYLFTAYFCVFLVMANGFREWSQLRNAGSAIVISTFIMAVFALMQKFSGTSDIYWFHTPRFGGSIFGPFTNRDHFAGHLNLAFGLTLGLLLAASRVPELRVLRSWREKAAWLSTPKASRIVLLAFAAMLMGSAVCVSLSRGGITSLAASLGIVGTFVALRSAVPKRGRVIVAVALLIVAGVTWLGWQPVVERLGSLADVAKDPLSDTRAIAASDTLRMFRAAPLFGSGFGSFEHVFPIFQSPPIQPGRFTHAHNDYVELLAEGGVIGAVLAVWVVILFVRTIWRHFPDATSRGRLLTGGIFVGIVAIALHSSVDFSLHKPANAFLLAALCGMSVAAVHLERNVKRHRGVFASSAGRTAGLKAGRLAGL